MDRKWAWILGVGGGLGLLAWLERDKFIIDSRKLLSVDQLKSQVVALQKQEAAQGLMPSGYLQTLPIDGRTQIFLTTPDQENKMGAANYKQILSSAKLCGEPAIVQMVQSIGWRLAAVVPPNDFDWEFNVVADSKNVNAFCLPGGKVVVYTGLLPWCQNEAALACVMGHEIGHAIARHGGERIAETGILSNAATGIQQTLKSLGLPPLSGSALAAFSSAAQMGLQWPFSRMQETEADDLGINYMAAAGYDPSESINFWQRMIQATDTGKPAIMSDHPASADRMKDLANRLDAAMEFYNAAPHFGSGDDIPTVRC